MKIDVPIIIAAMSFGALSCEAKIALAKASKLAGTIANTGEGGMLEGEREFSRRLIIQYSTGRFGISEDVLKKADAIEIKIGQGAKPGQGGMLLKEKITDKIAKIRGIDKTKDVHSPAYHSDINNIDDLKKKVDWLREISDGVPIIIKLGAGDVEQDVKLSVQAGCDIIAIDGMEGGTGAAPEVMLNDVGLPALAALAKARETLDEINAKQELWLGGGLSKGADFAKAIALGADAVFVGFPLLVAMGCIYCKKCYLGKCPKGICTQDIELRYQFDVEENANNAANYIKNCNEEIKMIAGACGKDNIHNLRKDDLRAMNSEISKITNVKLI
jgi:glutamate synthase domain-containing protein 2